MSRSMFEVVREYVSRMIPQDGSMKVLLVDEATLDIISMSFSQTELLEHGVFFVDTVHGTHKRNKMPTMRCVCFIRPTSVDALCKEVTAGLYQGYTVNFSNSVTADQLDQLARADTKGLIAHVEEFFADFNAINRDCFVVPFPRNAISGTFIDGSSFKRVADGLAASFVAMRCRPTIRFQNSSFLCKRVAAELSTVLKSDLELFDYRPRDTLLLIIDRNDDPVTPLLTPWTYQAMLHELVGLDRNTLHIKGEPCTVVVPASSSSSPVADDKPAEPEGYVFSQKDDAFFEENMYHNWGDLCGNVKKYVDHCKSVMNIDRSTATIEEVKQFMQKLPQTKSLTGFVTKHATVVSHLSNIIKERHLLEVSELEQNMVVEVDQSAHWSRLKELSGSSYLDPNDLLRLCILFNLRYEKTASPSRTDELLSMNTNHRILIRKAREYFGTGRPTDSLFASSGVVGSLATLVRGFSDVKNLYTQHEPVLKKTLINAATGKLDANHYPFLHSPVSSHNAPSTTAAQPEATQRPKEIIVFMCGGFTFEEAAMVNMVNRGWKGMERNEGQAPPPQQNTGLPPIKVLLGGTGIHNTKSFIELLGENP